MSAKRSIVGAAALAAVVAGGVAARQLVAGRRSDEEPELDPWPAGTSRRFLEMSDGARIHVAERGEGRPVVLLHGITLSAAIWSEQLARLPDLGLRAVAIDLRGHGASDLGPGRVHLDRVAADVIEVVERLGLEDVIVVGHSMGGMVALRLLTIDAAGRTRGDEDRPPSGTAGWIGAKDGATTTAGILPDSTVTHGALAAGEGWLSALALVATSARPAFDRGIPGVRWVMSGAGPVLSAAGRLASLLPGPSLPDSDVADSIAALTFAEDPSASAVRRTRRATARVPARVAAELLAEIVRLDESVGLKAIAVPTSVVVGTGDLITPPTQAAALAGAIEGAELVELEDCGHMVMLERPDALDEVIQGLAARRHAGA